MSRATISITLVAIGLLAGTLANRQEDSPPLRADGRWILAADLHVHAFFGDAGLAPWDLLAEARRRRLDVIAVTNHVGVFGGRFNRWWSERMGGPLVLAGQEITSKGYHLVGAGLQRRVEPRSSLVETIRDVHAQGGIAIAAHPGYAYLKAYTPEALALLDGVEAIHAHMYKPSKERLELIDFWQRARRLNPDVAFVGSSDFHFIRELGAARTYIIADEYSERGVLDAVRKGQTVAADYQGNLYGDDALVAFVRPHLDGRERERSADAYPAGRWLAVALVLVGFAGLVLFDGRPLRNVSGDSVTGEETASRA